MIFAIDFCFLKRENLGMTMSWLIKNINLDALANVCMDIAQVLFASLVIEGMISGNVSILTIAGGTISALSFWITSIIIKSIK